MIQVKQSVEFVCVGLYVIVRFVAYTAVPLLYLLYFYLQCFDAVGRASGRASGL